MLRAWMQRRWINKWILLLTNSSIWCFQIAKSAKGKLQFQNKTVLSTNLAELHSIDELKRVLPKRASLIICLPSEAVILQSFELDPKLSLAERHLFIGSLLSKSMKTSTDSLAFISEKVGVTSSGDHNQLVAGINKKHLTSLSKLIFEHQCSCIRLESMQITIAWWANKQRRQNKSRYWGVVEFCFNRLSLIFFDHQQVLYQKSFNMTVESEDINDSVSNMLQKIKQIISLLQIGQKVSLFCTPLLFSLLPLNKIEEVCIFYSLLSFDHELPSESGFNQMQMHYLAAASISKAKELD